jgi:hypothetical protein
MPHICQVQIRTLADMCLCNAQGLALEPRGRCPNTHQALPGPACAGVHMCARHP